MKPEEPVLDDGRNDVEHLVCASPSEWTETELQDVDDDGHRVGGAYAVRRERRNVRRCQQPGEKTHTNSVATRQGPADARHYAKAASLL